MDLQKAFHDAISHSIFSKIKTNNIIIDTIFSTILLSGLGFFVRRFYFYVDDFRGIQFYQVFDYMKSCFYRKHILLIEGRKTTASSCYNNSTAISITFSNRFKAIWHYLVENTDKNSSITELKEICNMMASTRPRYDDNGEVIEPSQELDLLIVSQKRPFLFNKELDIYVSVKFINDNDNNPDDKKSKTAVKIEEISIVLYSYTNSVSKIKEYVDSITKDHLQSIELERKPKKFIYRLQNNKGSIQEPWAESIFETNRTFENMFFDGKNKVIEKIQFFLENKKWYDEMGIPYTLGIGLEGPPGTGKSSFIKALAKFTNRHIILISLQSITTRKQLYTFWNESKYNSNNKKDSVPFSEKIIVIEDIDCAGDIVLQRDYKKEKKVNEGISIVDKKNDANSINNVLLVKNTEEDPICLDDILNIIDGVEETPGRILIISSNHYNKLDGALVRPGRIDITMKMENASRETIQEMYHHFYKERIPQKTVEKMKPKFYSPAEIINIYILNKDDSGGFIKRLLSHKKV